MVGVAKSTPWRGVLHDSPVRGAFEPRLDEILAYCARDPVERRILGLPVTAVLVIAVVILGLFALAGLILPRARRRRQARGGGTYGRR